MASMYVGGFGNWARVTDDLVATDQSWTTFETWTMILGNYLLRKYELAVAKQAAEDYELPKFAQAIFYPMLLNEAERLGVLPSPSSVGVPLSRGCSCIHPSGGSGITREEGKQRTLNTPISPFIIAFPPLYGTREMTDYVREYFIWRWRRATSPPRPLPEDYHVLYPHFSLPEAEGAAADFELPEMVQTTFYATLLNEAVELDVMHGFIPEA
ncbi:hypothetical protein Cgig2_006308 [Carnegiea gigantea]|uniref:Uncharacterized protein n=1 Tax=Carnegiea gigantea TaxID=171969 RepID=A0A9Q1QF89_9CARY|nr:hypothetical protein Cgig2_006308 [Carnegiea gigantea]